MKKNGFWIALGGGTAVAVLVFVLFVLPQWSAEADAKTAAVGNHKAKLEAIARGDDSVPTAKWVSTLRDHDAALAGQTKDLYKTFAASDAALEAWFPGMTQMPAKGELMSKGTDGISGMMRELREKIGTTNVPPDGKGTAGEAKLLGFEWANSDLITGENDLRMWMRRYNIHLRMKDAMKNAPITKFYRVQFSPTGEMPVEFNAKMKERQISNDLGSYIPVYMDVQIAWKNIPALLAGILRYDPEKPGPMFRIATMRIERDPTIRISAEEFEDVAEEDYVEGSWVPKKEYPEMPVRAMILIEAYDFKFPEALTK